MCGFILLRPDPIQEPVSVEYVYPTEIIVVEVPTQPEWPMIDRDQLRELIREVLLDVGLHSDSAEELLMLTAATESMLGTYIKQVGGPAEGIFQMEPRTEEDIWENFLKYKEDLTNKVLTYTTTSQKRDLKGNLPYQIIMARLHYYRVPERLPDPTRIEQLASYWKTHYNTYKGKGNVEEAVEKYNHYVVGG